MNNNGIDSRYGMFCVWDGVGEKKQVFAVDDQGPYTESVNTDTEGWLDVAILFTTHIEATTFNEKWALDGIVYNVGEFLNEHGC